MLDVIGHVARRAPTTKAIVVGDDALDYAELMAAIIDRSARYVAGVHVVRGEPVAALIDALAVHAAGGVPLVLGPHEVVAVPERVDAPWLRVTSGTSGTPKLLSVDMDQAVFTAALHAGLTDLGPGLGCVVTVPPWTSFGWNCWTGALLSGATLHVVAPTAPRDLLRALAEPTVTWGFTTPPVVRALARLRPSAAAAGKHVLTAASAYPVAEAIEVGARHGLVVIDRYGSSETGPIAQARESGGPLWTAPGVMYARVRAQVGGLDGELVAEVVGDVDVAALERVFSDQPPWQRPTHIAVVATPDDLTKWSAR